MGCVIAQPEKPFYDRMLRRLELAHELMPTATDVALLVNANNPTVLTIENSMEAAARSLGLRLHVLHAGRTIRRSRLRSPASPN